MVSYPQLLRYRKELNVRSTKSERVLVGRLRRAGLRVRVQVIIPPYIVDVLIPRKMLIVEVDGGIHDALEQQEYDARRTAYLTNLGFKVIRVKNAEVYDQKILEDAQSYPDVNGRRCKQVRRVIDSILTGVR